MICTSNRSSAANHQRPRGVIWNVGLKSKAICSCSAVNCGSIGREYDKSRGKMLVMDENERQSCTNHGSAGQGRGAGKETCLCGFSNLRLK